VDKKTKQVVLKKELKISEFSKPSNIEGPPN
jgi:hypothetical protein